MCFLNMILSCRKLKICWDRPERVKGSAQEGGDLRGGAKDENLVRDISKSYYK